MKKFIDFVKSPKGFRATFEFVLFLILNCHAFIYGPKAEILLMPVTWILLVFEFNLIKNPDVKSKFSASMLIYLCIWLVLFLPAVFNFICYAITSIVILFCFLILFSKKLLMQLVKKVLSLAFSKMDSMGIISTVKVKNEGQDKFEFNLGEMDSGEPGRANATHDDSAL